MRALILKELRGFLGSLIGQIVVVVFLLLTGLFLWVFPNNILDSGYADLGPLFFIAPWVFLFLVPAITMRSFSEEKRNGTIEFLLTKPLSEMHVVLAKYGASVLLVLFALFPTLIYVWVVDHLALAHAFPSDAIASSIAVRTWSITGIVLAIMIWSVFKKDRAARRNGPWRN
ncbi:MAG: ABC transporter permease [Flavobacteriales bacterium]|nr:ABC transporter permease [Flavobacteriales bacterium]